MGDDARYLCGSWASCLLYQWNSLNSKPAIPVRPTCPRSPDAPIAPVSPVAPALPILPGDPMGPTAYTVHPKPDSVALDWVTSYEIENTDNEEYANLVSCFLAINLIRVFFWTRSRHATGKVHHLYRSQPTLLVTLASLTQLPEIIGWKANMLWLINLLFWYFWSGILKIIQFVRIRVSPILCFLGDRPLRNPALSTQIAWPLKRTLKAITTVKSS